MYRLPTQPGTFACRWWIDGVSYAGNCRLEPTSHPTGRIFAPPSHPDATTISFVDEEGNETGTQGLNPQHPWRLSYLLAELENGRSLLLTEPTIDYWSAFGQGIIETTGFALLGFNAPNLVPNFGRIKFQVGGLSGLADAAPVESVQWPPDLRENGQFIANWAGATYHEWPVANGDVLRFEYEVSAEVANPFAFSVETYAVVTVEGEPRTLTDWWEAYVEPLRSLSSVSSGERQSVRWAIVEEPEPKGLLSPRATFQIYSSGTNQAPEQAEPTPQRRASLIRFGADVPLPALLDRWKALSNELPSFFELFTDILRHDLPVRSQFLIVVPALESYHAEKYKHGEQSIEEHRRERSLLLEKLQGLPDGLTQREYKFVRDWLDRRGGYGLERRLAGIVKRFPVELRNRINQATSQYPDAVRSLAETDSDSIWKLTAEARNRLAHGGEPVSDDAIVPLLKLALTLGHGIVLDELGVGVTPLTSAIDRQIWFLL